VCFLYVRALHFLSLLLKSASTLAFADIPSNFDDDFLFVDYEHVSETAPPIVARSVTEEGVPTVASNTVVQENYTCVCGTTMKNIRKTREKHKVLRDLLMLLR
jgi:hypothetical protein